MKQIESEQLLTQLQADIRRIILVVNKLKQEDPGKLMQQPAPGKWSVTQVLEHLNSYGRYYLPVVKKGLCNSKEAVPFFTPGWLGAYFTKSMQPKKGIVTNKMQAPKGHRPENDLDCKPVLDTFIEQQYELIELLELAKMRNINAIRIPISLSRFIKLKMGDAFTFLIAHEQRHFIQIGNTLETVKAADHTDERR